MSGNILPSLKFKPRLLLDALQITNTHILDRMSKRHLARLRWMLELVMIADAVYLKSAVCQKHFQNIS